jgi:Kelch motif protein
MFTSTYPNSMAAARARHTATLLGNGQVLIASGTAAGGFDSAELYHPWTFFRTGIFRTWDPILRRILRKIFRTWIFRTWIFSATGSMTEAREHYTATLLRNGKVLIAGGRVAGSTRNSAELYDPTTGTFRATTPNNMTESRFGTRRRCSTTVKS